MFRRNQAKLIPTAASSYIKKKGDDLISHPHCLVRYIFFDEVQKALEVFVVGGAEEDCQKFVLVCVYTEEETWETVFCVETEAMRFLAFEIEAEDRLLIH